MEEKSTINAIMATSFSFLMEFMEPLKWFFLLGLILVLADLRFGIEAARFRKEDVRFSRAIRRTVNKIVDYLCWIFLAGAIGKAFSVPFNIAMLPAVVMFVVYGIEINSCFSNFFEARGKNVKVNIFRFMSKKADIIEVEEKEDEKE